VRARTLAGSAYALQTGPAGAERLALLEQAAAPGTQRALLDAGLRPGMRVADVGCGTGAIAGWMAEQVGESGTVTGVDASPGQLAIARERLPARVELVCADARATGLPRGAFDLVSCRFLLMHLPDPEAVLRELVALVRPGGVVVCTEPDFTRWFAQPPSPALERSYTLLEALGTTRGQDWSIGLRVPVLLKQQGCTDPQVTLEQPVSLTEPFKRIPALNLVEARDGIVAAGLATDAEVDAAIAELEGMAADPNRLVGLAAHLHTWARVDQA
jgi:SAM-dependent methyltransferase